MAELEQLTADLEPDASIPAGDERNAWTQTLIIPRPPARARRRGWWDNGRAMEIDR
jgi:hypothetical protein